MLHKTIRKIDDDTEKFSYNTAVSAFMVCVNELLELKCSKKSVLEQLLILLSPYAPHITEELYGAIFDHRQGSVHQRGNWLKAEDFPNDIQAEQDGNFCVQLLNAVRKAKADKNLSMK